MAFKFERLKVWHKAVELSNRIDEVTRSFPKSERYNLAIQIKKAADSVVLNIAEGSTGQTSREFIRFLRMALRSGVEVVACLYLALSRDYIQLEGYKELYSEYEVLCKMISSLINSVPMWQDSK